MLSDGVFDLQEGGDLKKKSERLKNVTHLSLILVLKKLRRSFKG